MNTRRSILVLLCFCLVSSRSWAEEPPLEWIRVSPDGSHFVTETTRTRFVVWGVNYDHDAQGRLLDEYWIDEWDKVVEDFAEIKQLGANCVRVHLQLGMFMDSPTTVNSAALEQLKKLLTLAEEQRLYLDITGLACYHKANVPPWLDVLSEAQRWAVQARFWAAVAQICADSPAVFCYDLMNEPILPGKEPETQWLAGELAGKHFVQRIALDLAGRSREEVARQWVEQMTAAIKEHDQRHLITVGVIPWVFVFGGGQPLFHDPEVGKSLDFVSVHFYPERDEVEKAVAALKAYELGKPLVIEEMFPLKCSIEELETFIRQSSSFVDGWISFYWGEPAAVLKSKPERTMGEAITAQWLERFSQLGNEMLQAIPAD